MQNISSGIFAFLLVILTSVYHTESITQQPTTTKNFYFHQYQKLKYGEKDKEKSPLSKLAALRLATKSIHQSTRDDNENVSSASLRFKSSSNEYDYAYVPLRNVSVETWIDSFTADVTLTQVFVNDEENPIEAIYVFPIEENGAVYSFTAQIDDRIITAVLKEKRTAEEEYRSAVSEGHTAVLMQQSDETLDTFRVNIGALPPGKECHVIIRYVTELDLIDGRSIRFVVPTTIAPRYNPSLGTIQSPDGTKAKYVQKTSYSMTFQVHVHRGEKYKILQVANLSHPVNVSRSHRWINVSCEAMALDRDIILDIDLPLKRPLAMITMEQFNESSNHAILLAFTPRHSDLMKIFNGKEGISTEFSFIVDCSGSMGEANKIGLAKEAMVLFIRSLPVGSHFNIIRFGSTFDILFKMETLTAVYDEKTAKEAEILTRSMSADFGGTELLETVKYLSDHPPSKGRSRQIFLLTDGEVSNTNEVMDVCRSMSSNTRIFSFGLGHSPSRSLVKGLARATNGYFVFVPPNSKVDTYVGSQFRRALQPSLINARLEWHGLPIKKLQAPKTIPPLYINDRVLVYQLLENDELKIEDVSVDLIVDDQKICSIKLSRVIAQKRDTIRRLAAKALIQELQHEESPIPNEKEDSALEQHIITLSLNHQILSVYTAFVGIETTCPKINSSGTKVRHIPIQISKGDEHLFFNQLRHISSYIMGFHSQPILVSTVYAQSSIELQLTSLLQASVADGMLRHDNIVFINSSKFHPQAPGNSWNNNGDDAIVLSTFNSATRSLLFDDPVRWLIDQQSFNGAWLLDEKDIEQLTDGKLSLSTFQSTVTQSKDVLTTAIAIAVLELKYADQKDLWNAVVEKGRNSSMK